MSRPDPLPSLALDTATEETRRVAVDVLVDAVDRLSTGASLPRVAVDLRRLADRLTAGVDQDVERRLAAAEKALRGPALGAVLRHRRAA